MKTKFPDIVFGAFSIIGACVIGAAAGAIVCRHIINSQEGDWIVLEPDNNEQQSTPAGDEIGPWPTHEQSFQTLVLSEDE